MMKPAHLVLLASLLAASASGAFAQAPASSPNPGQPTEAQITAERTRIAGERAKNTALLQEQEAACYKRFAVNDCLNEVRRRSRDTLSDLRRQEVALNDIERKRRSADQMREIEEKSSARAQQADADRRARALADTRTREERAGRRDAEREERRSGEAGKATSLEAKQAGKANAQAERAGKHSGAAEEAARHQQKVDEATDRKARRLDKDAQRKKPRAKALPDPAAAP